MSYDELEASFDRFERVCGTSGKAGNIQGKPIEGGNPFEGRRSGDFPLPPLTDHPTGRLFATAATGLGYKPFPLPAGNASGPYENEYGCQPRTVQFLRLLQRLWLPELFEGLATNGRHSGAECASRISSFA
ncbi:MAG: hypothetical protein WDN30_15255 [Pararobbsia sp.]